MLVQFEIDGKRVVKPRTQGHVRMVNNRASARKAPASGTRPAQLKGSLDMLLGRGALPPAAGQERTEEEKRSRTKKVFGAVRGGRGSSPAPPADGRGGGRGSGRGGGRGEAAAEAELGETEAEEGGVEAGAVAGGGNALLQIGADYAVSDGSDTEEQQPVKKAKVAVAKMSTAELATYKHGAYEKLKEKGQDDWCVKYKARMHAPHASRV